ncbi:MAG: ferrochelatase [Burkholderiaceae bacterium]
MPVLPEPPYTHGSAPRAGVLLVQLGTPDAPTAASVRTYLAQFLSDPRVVEIPQPLWWLILHGVILRVRPAKSAAKYASIWMKEGSPLRVYTELQTKLLRGYLGHRGMNVEVAYAMRYGNPSVAKVIGALKEKGVDQLLVLPMYPQYSATTSASVFDAVFDACKQLRNAPELRIIKRWHDVPSYIDALAAQFRRHTEKHGEPDMLVMSFHGVPKRTLLLGDPYHCECHKTARLLRERLGWPEAKTKVTFQSRFGKAEWLKPYTQDTLIELARTGTQHAAIMCPGFPADCLETLEEIAMEVGHEFKAAGGKTFHYIPALNDSNDFIHALADVVQHHLQGWVRTASPADLALSEQRAKALGAAQ